MISSPLLADFNLPSFFSTVTPGQFPTYWFAPVRALNMVVLPQFGLPANAILIAIFHPPIFLHLCCHCPHSGRTATGFCQCFAYTSGKTFIPPLNCNDFDTFRIVSSQRQFISTDRDLDRITERRYFTNVDLAVFGNAHVHDSAAECALSVDLYNFNRCMYRNFT